MADQHPREETKQMTNYLLQFTFLLIWCLTQTGCSETPAEKAITGNHPNAHLARGGPRNGHDFVVYPDVLAKWIREIPEIARGTSADEVIRQMGEPDLDYENGPGIFWGPPADRIVVYYVAMDRLSKDEPLSSARYIESIDLVFDTENRYMTFWVDNPLHPCKLSAPPDQDLTSLILVGPAASTLPVGIQPVP